MTSKKIWTQLDLRCSASVGVRSGQKLLCDVKQRIGYKTCILRVLLGYWNKIFDVHQHPADPAPSLQVVVSDYK